MIEHASDHHSDLARELGVSKSAVYETFPVKGAYCRALRQHPKDFRKQISRSSWRRLDNTENSKTDGNLAHALVRSRQNINHQTVHAQ
jgi:hypothetical protein